MLYTLADIEAQASPKQLELGWQWFAAGRVTAPNIQRGGEIVSAVIAQPGYRPLRVYVRAFRGGDGTLCLRGECTCSRTHNCEHVVAVLLQALADEGATLEPPGGTGPARVQTRGIPPEPPLPRTEQSPQCLLYLLQLSDEGISIEPRLARPRARRGYSLGREFDPARAPRGTPARFLQPVDLDLLTALDRLPRSSDRTLLLAGSGSDRLLQSLLLTGRCHLHDFEVTPLRLGAARRIQLEWRSDEAGVQRLSGSTDPASELLRLATIWYLDMATGECGPLAGELPGAVIHALLTLPEVSPVQVKQVTALLTTTYPGVVLPLPRRFEIRTLQDVRPVPCLCLTSNPIVLGGFEVHYDSARLQFDYDGTMLDPDGPDTHLLDGRVVRVRRKRRDEQAAVRQLRKAGLARDNSGTIHDGAARFVPAAGIGLGDDEAWLDFQADQLPALRERGWRIRFREFRLQLCDAVRWSCDIERLARDDWFSIGLQIEVEGEHVELLPILLDALRQLPRGALEQGDMSAEYLLVPITDEQQSTRLLRLPMDRLVPLLQTLLEIYGRELPANTQRLHLSRMQLAGLTTLDRPDQSGQEPAWHWLGDAQAQQLLERLRDLKGIPQVSPPAGLLAELRPYQRAGLNWLQFLREFRFGGILADDMGLGKTLQALAHLLLERESGRADRPSLVVAPTSLMFNWRHEARRFTPQLKVLVLQGPHRKQLFSAIGDYDLVLTTYPLLARDQHALLAQAYHLLILDEAQVVKNPRAQASRVVRSLDARHRLCLTGTPMENHLGELWTLFDVLLPGLLGDSKHFSRRFRRPIEQHGDTAVAQRLRRRVRPFLLRRTKQQVATELPDKIEIVQRVTLAGRQRELYETVCLAMHHRVREEIERQGLAQSHIVVLDALLKLRQVCCDPRLVNSEQARAAGASAKLEMLMQLLPEMVEEGRRILLFSQFTSMLSLIEAAVKQDGIDFVKLTGRTQDRQTPVQRFQQGSVPLFLISLKAGGVGLNLTAADTVIHYDPWWNPAVERQATDRAHRIGQGQTVFVYKLICTGTVEEKIQAMQHRKQALADGLYEGGNQQEPQWRPEDLAELFAPLDNPATEPLVTPAPSRRPASGLTP